MIHVVEEKGTDYLVAKGRRYVVRKFQERALGNLSAIITSGPFNIHLKLSTWKHIPQTWKLDNGQRVGRSDIDAKQFNPARLRMGVSAFRKLKGQTIRAF